MSLLLHLFGDSYYNRPSSRVMDQHFGMVLDSDDLLQPTHLPKMLLRSPAGYTRNWKSVASEHDSGSTVTYGKDKYSANLDVQQFKPEELTIKLSGENVISVEGKHEEKEDEHGHIFRHFVRRYALPKVYDASQVQSNLSSDGALSIVAPRIDANEIDSKAIPIKRTGEPDKVAEQKIQDGEN